MPIDYVIDSGRRLVLARGRGDLDEADLFGYQREVWSRPELAGYNELMDMTGVAHIHLPSIDRILELSSVSAAMDLPEETSRFAIVAPDDLAFGLGRMYQAYRGLDQRSTKRVGVFRTMVQALAFLGLEEDSDPWELHVAG